MIYNNPMETNCDPTVLKTKPEPAVDSTRAKKVAAAEKQADTSESKVTKRDPTSECEDNSEYKQPVYKDLDKPNLDDIQTQVMEMPEVKYASDDLATQTPEYHPPTTNSSKIKPFKLPSLKLPKI